MLRSRLALTATMILISTASGCASASTARAGTSEPVTLEVTNNNSLDVDVYVMADGFTTRLGTVTTAQSRTFRLPDTATSALSVRLIADPIGSLGGYFSDPVTGIGPGVTISLTVGADLGMSHFSVR